MTLNHFCIRGEGSTKKIEAELPKFLFLKCLECSETHNKQIKHFSIFRRGLVLKKNQILVSQCKAKDEFFLSARPIL